MSYVRRHIAAARSDGLGDERLRAGGGNTRKKIYGREKGEREDRLVRTKARHNENGHKIHGGACKRDEQSI